MNEVWFQRALGGEYAAAGAAEFTSETPWAIDGFFTRTGSSVWFGPGATGKTQLLLQAAVSIAAKGRGGPDRWLGGEITRGGQVLVLSAEDTRDQVWLRLGKLARAIFPEDMERAREVCGRIHVMPFLSMTEEEFPHDAPGLFERQAGHSQWKPHGRMQAVRRFITEWNETRTGDDRICGVLMDSATSMAGCDTNDGQAVTNLMFYLNRLCEKLDIFWALIGHSQKEVRMDADRPRADAASRLRGAGMWSTAPRMTVEVRHVCDEEGKTGYKESAIPQLIRRRSQARDFVVVDVAKANVAVPHNGPRYLWRQEDGLLVDVTDEITAASAAQIPVPANDEAAPSDPETRAIKAIAQLIHATIGSKPGTKVVRGDLNTALQGHRTKIDGLQSVGPMAGSDRSPAPGAINWYLMKMVERGHLRQKGKSLYIVDLSLASELTASEAASIAS